MFKKGHQDRKEMRDDIETIIGPSVKIEGEFASSGNIMAAGVISGKLSTSQNLRVEEGAQINADISAQQAIIAGMVVGNIKIDGLLEILSTAKITGDIHAGTIAMQQGAYLKGMCTMSGYDDAGSGETKENRETLKERAKQEWLENKDENSI